MHFRKVTSLASLGIAFVAASSALLLLATCFGVDSAECPTGIVCPVGTRCAANAAACITDDCGDGEVQAGEACDDGNISSGDGCNSDCTSDETCGNGIVDNAMGEVCDDGNTIDEDQCSADCKSLNVCGNNIVDYNEECDDGNDVDGDGCDSNCTETRCGNNIVTMDEGCDDGNNVDGDGCDGDCTVSGCGNGVASGTEACDDGKNCQNGTPCINHATCAGIGDEECRSRDGDGCSADCSSDETCGNLQTDTFVGEVCDDGRECSDGTECTHSTDCAGIGDGQCLPRDGDGCSASCRSNETCGNLIVDTAASEKCDDGKQCSNGDDCTSNLTCAGIGDELCQPRSGDGCSSDCKSDETCGNGIVDDSVGEVCDDGKHCEDNTQCTSNTQCAGIGDQLCIPRDPPLGATTGCRADCAGGAACGNGLVDTGEECDDANEIDEDNCVDCVRNVCGDGYVDLVAPRIEECDDAGNSLDCNANCTFSSCGDGYVNGVAGEQCDNGSKCADGTPCSDASECVGQTPDELCQPRDSTYCDFDCTVALCGDGHANLPHGEACDDGGESETCNANCTAASCPDGVVNTTAGEQCDGNGETALCDTDCTIALCGDGTTNTTRGEVCDDGGNSLACDADCTLPVCGDGFVNPLRGELCDNLHTCENGTACDTNADCTTGDGLCKSRDSVLCDDDCTIAICGDAHLNTAGGEQCDEGTETDTCNENCTLVGCGDGLVNTAAGEECDDGGETAACDSNCTIAYCGDGDLNTSRNEECDDAVQTYNCDEDCTLPVCGDGLTNTAHGETCDDGKHCDDAVLPRTPCTATFQCAGIGDGQCIPRSGDGCSDTCNSNEDCGNGLPDPGEVCDDGNNLDGDGCSANCLSLEICGNGILDANASPPEYCDDGEYPPLDDTGGCDSNCKIAKGSNCNNAVACSSGICNLVCQVPDGFPCYANNQCVSTKCTGTDQAVDTCLLSVGEDCSPATPEECASGVCADTGSGNKCQPSNQCGNGVIETGEGCDDGPLNGGTTCSSNCLIPTAASTNLCNQGPNGLIGSASCESGVCDDTTSSGNPADGFCEPANTCGNGKLETGELCDDGNVLDGDLCDSTCSPVGCGNGVVNEGEGCDPPDVGKGCSLRCKLEDGEPCNEHGSTTADESCDSDGCSTDGSNECLASVGAQCTTDADCGHHTCDTTESPKSLCEEPDECGNNHVEEYLGTIEYCDNGANNGTDNICETSCKLSDGQDCTTDGADSCHSGVCDTNEPTATCEPSPSCANGDLDPGEDCDPGGHVDTATCDVEDGSCSTAVCNDGYTNAAAGEMCDDSNNTAWDGCGPNCLWEIGHSCTHGANAECESGWCDTTTDTCACDGDADCPASQVCDTTPTTNACEPAPGCGNNHVESGETCDDGGTTAWDGCGPNCLWELGHSCTTGADAECESNWCDPTGDICACDEDTDCPGATDTCDTAADPNVCVSP